MFKTISLGIAGLLVVAIGAVLVVAATKPDIFRVTRMTSIAAPPEKVFPFINEFRRWSAWSPYENKDPAMKRNFNGPPGGKGAFYAWDGNSQIGQGSMEITEAVAPEKIVLKLDFVRPFEAHNVVEFTLRAQGAATEVTWDMQGPVPYLAKIAHVLFDMDRMVGGDFEAGLASLKIAAER